MRRSTVCYIAFGAAALIASFQVMAWAAPTYGTDMPPKGGVVTGYQNNIIFKHDLSDSYGSVRSDQHFYDISFGAGDRLSLDGKIGLGNILRKGGTHPKVYYDYGFAGGYGFRLLVKDDPKNKIKIVAGFHHISVHPLSRNISGDKYESILDDWQCSLVSSRQVGIFSPFLGFKISKCDLLCRVNEIDRKRRPPEHYAGVVVGCAARIKDSLSVRIEAHFIDESSLAAGIWYRF